MTYDKTAGYDAAGNVTSHLLDQFQYDGLNVLTKAYVASKWRSYVYNANDERIGVIERSSATGAETRSDWTLRDASGQVLRRLSREGGQWQWNEDYIYRGSQMLAAEVAGPAKRYHYHLDHLGTPRLITGNGGVEISRHTYLPFGTEAGAIAGQNPADGEWKKFTGHERDQGWIDYMHARYYNAFVGRFLSVDPSVRSINPAQPQTWNRYTYAYNNPLRFTDPDGEAPKSVDFKVGRFDAHLDFTHSVRNPAPHVDVKEGPRKLGRFHFDKWAAEKGSEIPKSFVNLFEKLAERGQLPAKVLREIAKHAPAVVKVAGRAAPVVGAVVAIVSADRADAAETAAYKEFRALAQEMFGKKIGELSQKQLEDVQQRYREDRASDGTQQ